MAPYTPPDRKNLRTEYDSIIESYKYLSAKVKGLILDLLKKNSIKIIVIENREKKFDSFYNKIITHEFSSNYFENSEDLAGARFVCLYFSDLDRIGDIIETNFDVIKKKRLNFEQRVNATGYQSDHYIIKLRQGSITPSDTFYHPKLNDLLCEVQVRTTLMHSWASVSHHLFYKKNLIPEFQRDMYALSSFFFFADHQFDRYMDFITKQQTEKPQPSLDLAQEINVDSIASYLNFKFPKRPDPNNSSYYEIVEELTNLGYNTLNDVEKLIERAKNVLETYETENPISPTLGSIRDVVGALRVCLEIGDTNNKKSNSFYVKDISKYRGLLND